MILTQLLSNFLLILPAVISISISTELQTKDNTQFIDIQIKDSDKGFLTKTFRRFLILSFRRSKDRVVQVSVFLLLETSSTSTVDIFESNAIRIPDLRFIFCYHFIRNPLPGTRVKASSRFCCAHENKSIAMDWFCCDCWVCEFGNLV